MLRRVISALSVGLLAVIGLVAVPGAAMAAPNTDVVVSDVELLAADGTPFEGPVKIGDTLLLTGEWDATDATPKDGDTFTIGLPVEFVFPSSVPFGLTGPDGDGVEQTWATCLTDPDSGIATCTFTPAVSVNPELVQGTFGVEVKAQLETEENELTFDLNGVPAIVEIPGGEGIIDPTPLPTDWSKSGVLNANKWSMTWKIELPGARMVGHDAVTIRDTLGSNHQLCDPSGLKIETVRGSTVVNVTTIGAIVDGATDDVFDIVLTAPDAGFDKNVTYRITYLTCTPDGQIDPQGTEYENSASVDVWGESSGVIGVEQDWAINDKVIKQGSVLGGSDRNSRIEWTATVPGSNLVGESGFTVKDELTGAHAVAGDTISGIRVFERYGPAGTLVDITDELTKTTVASTATSFEVRLDITAGSDYAFQPTDHMYLIRYQTAATTDGLPEGGTVFDNKISVDGEIATGTSKVPGRTAGKYGKVNDKSVTLNGVEHLPQTTLGWTVRIPGERLADLDGPLTLTDTLSESHQVCIGDSSDVAVRMGLDVEARDQIGGGGLTTVDINATATVVDKVVTFTIPLPTLTLPDGTTATGFSHEYEYVLNYTTCTTSGGMDAKGTEYSNAVTGHGVNFTQRVSQSNSGFGTGQGMPRGTVAISKTLADTAGAAFVPDGTAFTVHVKEIDPKGVMQSEYDLQVPLNGDPASGFNSRGNGWTIELSELSFPSVPGVTWGAPVFQASTGVTPSADGMTATAELTPGSNIAVDLVNEAKLGAIQVTKALTGPDAATTLVDPEQTYRITAKIDTTAVGDGFPAQADRVLDVRAGAPVMIDNLPIGATVTFSEARPADTDLITWSAPVISPQSLVVTAEHATASAAVTVTNHVERTVGTFSIVKSVTGAQADNQAVPETVTVTASWTQDGVAGHKTLTVSTDGTALPLGENLLIGTQVTLTETPLADGSSIAWGAPVWSGTGVAVDGESAVVTIGRDAAAQVTLENHAATSVAGISLLKGIAGAAADEVAAETEFPVTATWTDADGTPQSKDLTINAVTPTSLGVDLPAGTIVTVTEGERPGFDTVIWGSITISGDDVTDSGDGSAEIVVSDQQGDSTFVTVVNEANWAPGTFTLSKSVTGVLIDNADVPESVTVTASWVVRGELNSADVTLPTDGTPVSFGRDLPHGTTVLLSEIPIDDSAAFTWNTPIWAGDAIVANEDGTATLIIGAATDAKVEVTNSVTALLGSLSVTKTLSGDGASLAEGIDFPVTATWTDLLGESHQVDITVRAGEPTLLANLPLGTEVTLVEDETKLPANAKWLGGTWSSDDERVDLGEGDSEGITIMVTGDSEPAASIALDNEFEKIPDLAVTGGSLISAGIVVLAALLMGAGILLITRRKRA